MAKKAPSAYNKHVGKQMKAGKTMKQAAALWDKKAGKPKSSAKTTGKRSSSKSSSKTNTRSKGMTIGGYSPLGIVKAGVLYLGSALIIGRTAPQVAAIPGGIEVAAGGLATVTGLPGVAFLALGAAKFIGSFILRSMNGGGISNGGGGYDY